jgi:UDP-glucose 4-epimerase
MKIVIFGGGGFIGSNIADRLLQDGHELRIFERPHVPPYREFSSSESVEWIAGDLMSDSNISEGIDGVDVVIHLVSTTLPKSSNDDPIFDVQSNLIASLQLLSAMVKKKVPRIIFISSGGTVYGNPIYTPIDENHPTNPTVSYGITKLAIEKYLILYKNLYGINSTILRVANPFGERQRIETAQGAVGVFISKALQNKPIDIWGDGNVVRDYIYVSDVAEVFAKAVFYTGSQTIFNVSSGYGTSLNDLINMIEQAIGTQLHRNYLPSRPFDIPISILNNSLAQKELAWSPVVSMEEGIAKTVEWMKK